MICDAVNGRGPRVSMLLAVFAGALLVRLVALFEGIDNPSFSFPIVDAGAYDAIARELANSGELSPRLFWQPFLYPVFLAGTYLLSGGSILTAKLLQAIIGALTCGVVFLLGTRQFGNRIGLAAAAITALYGPLILFEGELLATGLVTFWCALLVLLLTAAIDSQRPLLLVSLGSVAAASLVTRPTVLPFLAVGSVYLLLRVWRNRGSKPAIIALAVVLAAAAPILMTVGLLSQRVIGEVGLLPSSGGLNAYIGNNPEICETLTIRPGDDWGELIGRPARAGYESQGDANRYFYREVARFGREMPLSFFSGLGSKALRFASSRELPRNFDPYLAGKWSFVQRILTWKIGQFGFPFGVLLPLAIIGIIRSWRRIGTPALLFLSLYPASVVLIFVASRYRVPIIPVLSIAAAAGGAALLADIRKRRWKRLVGAATIFVVTCLVATLPGPFCEERKNLHADFLYCLGHSQNERDQPDLAIASYQRALAEDPALPQVHYNLGLLFRDRRDLDAAARHFGEAIRLDPGHVRALNNLGSVAESQGNLAEAERRFGQALGLDPKLAVAQRNLGNIRLQLGRPADALGPLRRALEIDPNDANALFLLGSSLMQTGDGQGAIASLQRATQLKSDPRFHNELGTALIDARRLDEAAEQFRIAIELSPDWVAPHNNAGAALAMNGDILGAIEFIRRAIEIEPSFADAHYNLASLLLRLGRTDEARAELVTVLKLRPDHPQAVARLNALGGAG